MSDVSMCDKSQKTNVVRCALEKKKIKQTNKTDGIRLYLAGHIFYDCNVFTNFTFYYWM